MSSVDDRVVNMKIENRQFLSGVKSTLSALTSLTQHIKGADKTDGLNNMAKSTDGLKTKFSALNVAAMTVVATITNKLVNAGLSMVKSLTLAPLMDGFHEYQTNLNSIQTVMANTGASVGEVNKYMNDLNHYSDKTIYNFSEMAKNIGTFTAAGVDLKTSTASIKGIANLAALSGSSSQQASTAMYQLSQAIASGRVGLQDWNSVVNAGMGGKTFQKALANTATTMGVLGKDSVATSGKMKKLTIDHISFRDSIQTKPGHQSWLTDEVLVKTLQQFTGDMTDAQLAAQGFTKAQIKSIQAMADTAQKAATRIKTFPQMMDVIKESIGSGWAQIFQDIFGNFTQSAKLWTGLGNSIVNSISGAFGKVDTLLKGWGKKGGRQDVINGFKNMGQPIIAVFKAIGEGWRMVFPAATAQSLKDMTQRFEDFTKKLHVGGDTANKIRDVFAGFFSVIHAGVSIIGLIFHAIFGFFGLFSGGASGGILSVAASIGQLLQKFDDFVSGKAVDGANGKLDEFFGKFDGVGPLVSKFASSIGNGLKTAGNAVKNFFSGVGGFNFGAIFAGLATGGALLAVRKFMKTLDGLFGNANGMIKNIKSVFGALQDRLQAMNQNIKAGALLKIAGAVGILAASLLVLSLIPGDKMAQGLAGVAGLMATLVVGLSAMAKINKSFSLVLMATSLDLLAAAILALSAAVAVFGMMDPKTLAQGLAGVAASILVLVGASALMSKFGGSFIMAATSLTILSVALDLLAGTILIYSKISFETLAHGLIGMGGALLVIAAAMRAMPKGMLLQAAALTGIALSITILAGALKILGSMSLEELGKGLGAMAIGLGVIALALMAMQGTLAGAAALIIASGAIVVLTAALAVLGNMSVEDLAKGLGALAIGLGLLILAGAGAQAVSVGLLALGVAVVMIGTGVGIAAAGLGVLALGLAALGAVGTAAIAVIVLAIKEFLKLLPSIAVAAAKAFVAFVGAIATNSPKIVNSFVKIISSMIDGANKLLPKIFTLFNNFLDKLLKTVNQNAPKMGHTFQILINTALTVLRNSIPKMVNTGMDILQGILTGISNKLPKLMSTATDIVVKFINGIANHMAEIIKAGTNLVIKFIVGIGDAASKIVDAAGKTILKFLNAVDASVKKYSGRIGEAGRQIGYDLVNGLTGGLLGKGISAVENAVATLASHIPGPIKKIMGIASPSKVMMKIGDWVGLGLADGISGAHKAVRASSEGLAQATIETAKKVLDIHSPSGVFKSLGINVTKGFALGITNSLNTVVSAGLQMAKDTFDMVSRTTTDLQLKADAQAAKADALRFEAAITRQKLHNKKLTKAQKAGINARAKALDNSAAAWAKSSGITQSQVDAVNKREDDARAFDAADAQGRADILNQRAQDAAASAEANRKNAIKLSEEANRIRSMDAKRAKSLAAQAAQALRNAEAASNAAKTNALQAQQYAIQAVLASSNNVAGDLNSWLAQEESDRAFAAMTTEQQKAEMERRAAEDQKRSDELIQSARNKLAQANALAGSNAQAAQLLVESAAADVEAAKAAKDQAASEADQAKQLVTDVVTGATDQATAANVDAKALAAALKMPDITIASSAVFGAQNMFDAYAKALSATTSAAEADKLAGVTFNQYNTSPEALSPAEVYRQSKNLLSNAERKLAGAL